MADTGLTYEGGLEGFGTRADMAAEIARLSAREERLRELLLALLDAGVIRGQWAKTIRVALS